MADKTPAQIKQEEDQKKREQEHAAEQKRTDQIRKENEEQKKRHEEAARNPNHPAQQPATPPKQPTHKSSGSGHDYATKSKEGQFRALKHAHEARIKELEMEIESVKKQQEFAEKLAEDDLTGELGHGERGFLILGEDGMPTGEASAEMPAPGTIAAPVVGYFPVTADTLVTPSGAPIQAQMNPLPDPRDTGMEARIKESLESAGQDTKTNKQKDAEHIQPGSPVVNTPARV
jgi:hypothetical protein